MPAESDLRAAIAELADDHPDVTALVARLGNHNPRRTRLIAPTLAAAVVIAIAVVASVLAVGKGPTSPVTPRPAPTLDALSDPRHACDTSETPDFATFDVNLIPRPSTLRAPHVELAVTTCAGFRLIQSRGDTDPATIILFNRGVGSRALLRAAQPVHGYGIVGVEGTLTLDPTGTCESDPSVLLGAVTLDCKQHVLMWQYSNDEWGLIRQPGSSTRSLLFTASSVDANTVAPLRFAARLTALPGDLRAVSAYNQFASSASEPRAQGVLGDRTASINFRTAARARQCAPGCEADLQVTMQNTAPLSGGRSAVGGPGVSRTRIDGAALILETNRNDGNIYAYTQRGNCALSLLARPATVSAQDLVAIARGAEFVPDCAEPKHWPTVNQAVGG